MRICPRCKGTGKLGTSHYAKGRKYEWKVRDRLREKGFTVYRSYGSKGALDLVAIRQSSVFGIQCKNTEKSYLPPSDRAKLAHVFQNRDYTISYWDTRNSKITSITLRIDIILHCYGKLKFREMTGIDSWKDYKL